VLRLLVLLLLLGNGAYFAWTRGLLEPVGLLPVRQTEPERVTQQIRPEAVRILSADDARRAETAGAARPAECLQAGLFDDSQGAALRQTLESGWQGVSWTLEPSVEPARWMVYMGRYPDVETLNRKKAELRARQILFQTLSNPAMEPGVSLGSFGSQDAANQALATLSTRGVRTARVVQERPEVRGQVLRLSALDETQRARLDQLRPLLAGKALRACR
jgi:hypothetical protein